MHLADHHPTELMNDAELAEYFGDACVNCGDLTRLSRTIEPWGELCSECDDAMDDFYQGALERQVV